MAHLCTLMGIRHSPRTASLLGQMASSKYKIETLVHTYECSYMKPLKIGHSKSICTLMHIILNHFQNSIFLLMKLFLTQDPEYPLSSIYTLLEIPLRHVFHAIVLNFQNILITKKQISIRFSTAHSQNFFPQWFLAVENIYEYILTNILHRT